MTTYEIPCAFTAIFRCDGRHPASMLTFGFEIEAQRLVLKRRERRLRRRIRPERPRTTGSRAARRDGDAHFLARERQRQSRCRGGRRAGRTCRRPKRTRRSSSARRRRRRSARPPRTPGKQAQYDSLLGPWRRAAGRALRSAVARRVHRHACVSVPWKRKKRSVCKRRPKDVTTVEGNRLHYSGTTGPGIIVAVVLLVLLI